MNSLGVIHGRVERGDELFGDVQFVASRAAYAASAAGRRAAHRWSRARQAGEHAEQRQWKPGREQRIDDASGRRQQRPAFASDFAASERQARAVRRTAARPRGGELVARPRADRASRRCQAGCPVGGANLGGQSGRSARRPALVTPLLNRSTQIQPPGKTWCRAAASGGYGGAVGRRRDQFPGVDVFEVCVQALRGRQPAQRARCRAQSRWSGTRGPAGVDDERRPRRQPTGLAACLRSHGCARVHRRTEFDCVSSR